MTNDESIISRLEEQFAALEDRYASLLREYDKLQRLSTEPKLDLKLAVFDRLPLPIWACDRTCKIVFWNEAAARLYGYTAKEAIGKDFVELFVNKPEQAQARVDCISIIDNDRPIKNMAEDIDKHGNTRRLVTQCFAVYDVGGYEGLQVEISYEVQDIGRLERELASLQGAFAKAEIESAELLRRLTDATRERGRSALEMAFKSARERIRERQRATDKAELVRGSDKSMIIDARRKIKADHEALMEWEREMRTQLMTSMEVEDIEELILAIERKGGLGV